MWRDVYKASDGFLKPLVLANPPALPIPVDVVRSIFDGLSRSASPYKWNYLRGYVEGREDYGLPESFAQKLAQAEDVPRLISDCFGAESVHYGSRPGLIINGGLQWSEELQSALIGPANEIANLYEGIPFTIDLTFFIGAYGATPFGVHVDDASHRTILFNLGPHKKGMAVWENSEIHAQFGKVSNIADQTLIRAEPQRFYFSTGEAFVLPSSRYHVGLNSSLSVTAAVVIDLTDDEKSVRRECELLIPSSASSESQPSFSDLCELRIREVSGLHELRSRSNNHLRYPIDQKVIDRSTVKPETTLKRAEGFPSLVAHFENFGFLFSRGRHLAFAADIGRSAVSELGLSRSASVSKILDELRVLTPDLKERLRTLFFLLESRLLEVAR